MPLANDSVIWIGKSTGLTLENYNEKWSIKSVRKYQGRDGKDVLTYDWIYVEEYDKDQKKRVMSAKPRPASIYFGDKETAIKALANFLRQLGAGNRPIGDGQGQGQGEEVEDIPF